MELNGGLVAAIEQAAEAVVITDADANIQYVNPAFTKISGYTSDEVIGKNPRILKSGREDADYYRLLWQEINAGRVWKGEIVNRRKDGTLYCEAMTISPVRDSQGRTTHFIALKQDITERRAASDLQAFLASIVQWSDDAIIGTDLDGKITSWNKGAETLYGYSPGEVIGKPVNILEPPDCLDEMNRMMETCRSGFGARNVETVRLGKDGQRIDVSRTAYPVRNDRGTVVGFVGIARDIRERRRAKSALLDREERFRTAFEHAPSGMCLSAVGGRLIQVNKTMCQMLDYTSDELLELGWPGITHPDDIALSFQASDRLLHNEDDCVELEKRYIRKGGKLLWARIRVSLVGAPDGSRHFITHIEDITERRLTEQALHVSEEKYRRLVANIPNVIWTSNAAGKTTYISPNVETLCGYNSEEIIAGGEDLLLRRIHDDDRDRVRGAIQALFSNNTPFNEEYRIQCKDGRWIWIHDRAITTFDHDGLTYADGIFSEITARKEDEGLLIKARDAAEAANRAKCEFIANMGHEIRTPMNGVIGMTNLVLEGNLSADQRGYLNDAKSSAEALLDVIANILDFSRIESRKVELEHIPFDLPGMLETTIGNLSIPGIPSDVKLSLELDPWIPPVVVGDPTRLKQILVNIVGNALKFTPAGKVAVRVEHIKQVNSNVVLQFTIQDTGIGIPEEKQAAIFDAFVQADTSSTRRFGGTGLGLTIASQLIQMMGGRIWLESAPSSGTIVYFQISLEMDDWTM